MGNEISTTEEVLNSNEFLLKLSSQDPVLDVNYWDKNWAKSALSELSKIVNSTRFAKNSPAALNTNIPLSLFNPFLLDEAMEKHSLRLCENNLKTGSLVGLVFLAITWLHEDMAMHKNSPTENDGDFLLNSLVLLRILFHRMILHCSSNSVLLNAHFNSIPPNFDEAFPNFSSEKQHPIRSFLRASFLYITEMEATTRNYLIHLEILHILMSLFSTTLYGGIISPHEDRKHNIFLEGALQFNDNFSDRLLVTKFSHKLLEYYMIHRKYLSDNTYSPLQLAIQSSLNRSIAAIFSTLGSAAGAIIYLPYTAFMTIFSNNDQTNGNSHSAKHDQKDLNRYKSQSNENFSEIVGRRCILILLFLSFYNNGANNPFLHALSNFKNSDDLDITSRRRKREVSEQFDKMCSFHFSFSLIYKCIVHDFEEKENAIFCYQLLHCNKQFLEFVLSRPDTDTIMLPLLHKLYTYSRNEKSDDDGNHIYMLCTILLILSQDSSFNSNNHLQLLNLVPWYRETVLQNIRLGSLTAIILFRTMQFNIHTRKDLYLNDNCLAVLNNMSTSFESMHTACAQKFLQFIKILTKKSTRILERLGQNSHEHSSDYLITELRLYLRFLQMCMESLNSIFSQCLKRNQAIIYELLQQKDSIKQILDLSHYLLSVPFNVCEDIAMFEKLITNLSFVMEFFDGKLHQYERLEYRSPDQPSLPIDFEDDRRRQEKQVWSSVEIMGIIELGVKAWVNQYLSVDSRFLILDHSMFSYSEDDSTENFFLLYLWKLIVDQVDQVVWNLDQSILMNDNYQTETDSHEEDDTETDSHAARTPNVDDSVSIQISEH